MINLYDFLLPLRQKVGIVLAEKGATDDWLRWI